MVLFLYIFSMAKFLLFLYFKKNKHARQLNSQYVLYLILLSSSVLSFLLIHPVCWFSWHRILFPCPLTNSHSLGHCSDTLPPHKEIERTNEWAVIFVVRILVDTSQTQLWYFLSLGKKYLKALNLLLDLVIAKDICVLI